MKGTHKVWRSPKAWLKSAVMVSVVWFAVYFFTENMAAATVVATIFVLMGVAGVLFT